MKVSLLFKEDTGVEEDSVTISIIRNSKERSQAINAKDLTDLTAVEQEAIKKLIETVQKYSTPGSGATTVSYTL